MILRLTRKHEHPTSKIAMQKLRDYVDDKEILITN